MDTGYEFKVNNGEEGMEVKFITPIDDGFTPMETTHEVPVQEQLNDNLINEIIEKIISNDIFIDIVLKKLVDKLELTSQKRKFSI